MAHRRELLRKLSAAAIWAGALGGYASGIEPFRARIARYALTPPGWPPGFRLSIAALADFHACDPWMTPRRIEGIAARADALRPDLIVLLGDYVTGTPWASRDVPPEAWARALSGLAAPLGVHAVLGNHDWLEDEAAQARGRGPIFARRALEAAGVPVLENRAIRLGQGGRALWLAGLGDQRAIHTGPGRRWRGMDDLAATLAPIEDDAPAILLAHEPDIFPEVPARVALTLSGHTHGGQVRLFGYAPVVPSRFKRRYVHGHVVEARRDGARHLIVSAGLGCSGLPVRIGAPPEIVLVELGG